MIKCIYCGDTGRLANLSKCPHCDVASKLEINANVMFKIPKEYQGNLFCADLLPSKTIKFYGATLEKIHKAIIEKDGTFSSNVLICSPPKYGKSTLAYSLISILRSQGRVTTDVLSLNDVKDYFERKLGKDLQKLIKAAELCIVRIPLYLYDKFGELMVDLLRERCGLGFTLFLYDGEIHDLTNQDKYSRLKDYIGDGQFNTLQVFSFSRKQLNKEEGKSDE